MCHYTFVHKFDSVDHFQNVFTVIFSMKFATKPMSYTSSHFKGVTPLLCKTQKTETGNILLQVTQSNNSCFMFTKLTNIIGKIKYAYAPCHRACRIILIRQHSSPYTTLMSLARCELVALPQ